MCTSALQNLRENSITEQRRDASNNRAVFDFRLDNEMADGWLTRCAIDFRLAEGTDPNDISAVQGETFRQIQLQGLSIDPADGGAFVFICDVSSMATCTYAEIALAQIGFAIDEEWIAPTPSTVGILDTDDMANTEGFIKGLPGLRAMCGKSTPSSGTSTRMSTLATRAHPMSTATATATATTTTIAPTRTISGFTMLSSRNQTCLSKLGLQDLTASQCVDAVKTLFSLDVVDPDGFEYNIDFPHGCFDRGDGNFFFNTGGASGAVPPSYQGGPFRICGITSAASTTTRATTQHCQQQYTPELAAGQSVHRCCIFPHAVRGCHGRFIRRSQSYNGVDVGVCTADLFSRLFEEDSIAVPTDRVLKPFVDCSRLL